MNPGRTAVTDRRYKSSCFRYSSAVNFADSAAMRVLSSMSIRTVMIHWALRAASAMSSPETMAPTMSMIASHHEISPVSAAMTKVIMLSANSHSMATANRPSVFANLRAALARTILSLELIEVIGSLSFPTGAVIVAHLSRSRFTLNVATRLSV